MTTLIRAGIVLTLDDKDHVYQPGYIIIEKNHIIEVGKIEELDPSRHFDSTIELPDRLLMPGLINAHNHSPMVLFRGMAEGHSLFTFDGWFNTVRVVEQVMEPDMLAAAVTVSCAEMIRTGTTCFADQYFWMDQIVPQVRKSKMRAVLCYGIVELGEKSSRDRELKAAGSFLQSIQGDPLITGWLGPHAFFVDNSEEAIKMELELADRFNAGLHFHLATSGEEDRYCQKNYGYSAAVRMQKIGLLDHRLLAAHGITVPPEDFNLLARYPFTIVAAPSSAMKNAAGFAPIKAMWQSGINLALGTDNVTNNNSYDMFKEMQLLGKVTSMLEREVNVIPTREIIKMATLGGAKALGMEKEIGSLQTGKKADLITLDLGEIGWVPHGFQDLYTSLVYSITGQHVRDVMIDGDWVFRNNQLTLIDYPAACAQMEADCTRLKQRVASKVS
jgi:5-methylthioadenosine/S-adenosylhomocysteine deaminase